MSPGLEKVLQVVDELPEAEQFDLYTHLRGRFKPYPGDEGDESAEIEADWDGELENRVRDVEEGKVVIVSGEEFERRTAALFDELGIRRQADSVPGA
jgi:hypothetical protein